MKAMLMQTDQKVQPLTLWFSVITGYVLTQDYEQHGTNSFLVTKQNLEHVCKVVPSKIV